MSVPHIQTVIETIDFLCQTEYSRQNCQDKDKQNTAAAVGFLAGTVLDSLDDCKGNIPLGDMNGCQIVAGGEGLVCNAAGNHAGNRGQGMLIQTHAEYRNHA